MSGLDSDGLGASEIGDGQIKPRGGQPPKTRVGIWHRVLTFKKAVPPPPTPHPPTHPPPGRRGTRHHSPGSYAASFPSKGVGDKSLEGGCYSGLLPKPYQSQGVGRGIFLEP